MTEAQVDDYLKGKVSIPDVITGIAMITSVFKPSEIRQEIKLTRLKKKKYRLAKKWYKEIQELFDEDGVIDESEMTMLVGIKMKIAQLALEI